MENNTIIILIAQFFIQFIYLTKSFYIIPIKNDFFNFS